MQGLFGGGGFSEEGLLAGVELQAPAAGPSARILVAGDICTAYSDPPPGAEATSPWSALHGSFAAHDLCLATLECPLTSSDDAILKSGPRLRGRPAWAPVLRRGGFDLVSLANNHIRDHGDVGVLDTVTACESAGLQTVGAGEDLAHARRASVQTVAGLRVGILAVAENEFGSARLRLAGGNPYDPLTTPRDVGRLRDETDAVLVLLHAGTEGYRLPSPDTTRMCRALAQAGATAVVCCHTHVPSGIEVYEGSLIAYGTGNFFFTPPPGTQVGDDWYRGCCVSISIGRNGVWRFMLVPYQQRAGLGIVEPLTGAAVKEFVHETLELSKTIADDEHLARRWTEFCRASRESSLAAMFGLGRVERRLLRHGVWPFWRISRQRVPALLNVVRCESHRERLTTTLELECADVERREECRRRRDGRR